MVRVRQIGWVLALVALTGMRPALASGISVTGNVANDFPQSNSAVTVTQIGAGPGWIAGPDGSTPGTLVGGWDIQAVRTYYNSSTDTLFVGIQGYKNAAGQEEIFGDATGNPNAALDPNPNFGGTKSVAVQFAPVTTDTTGQSAHGTPVVIAGIPADKSKAGSGTIDGFTVSKDTNMTGLPQYSFGQQLTQFTGNLASNPSAANPDLEFAIPNFSKIPGLNGTNGFYFQVYAGSGNDANGEVNTGWYKVPALAQEQIPEPTTWMIWAAVCGAGAGWNYRRSRRAGV